MTVIDQAMKKPAMVLDAEIGYVRPILPVIDSQAMASADGDDIVAMLIEIRIVFPKAVLDVDLNFMINHRIVRIGHPEGKRRFEVSHLLHKHALSFSQQLVEFIEPVHFVAVQFIHAFMPLHVLECTMRGSWSITLVSVA